MAICQDRLGTDTTRTLGDGVKEAVFCLSPVVLQEDLDLRYLEAVSLVAVHFMFLSAFPMFVPSLSW